MILLVGTFPPPIGGVTVHVKRLLTLLSNNRKDVTFFDIRDFAGNKKNNVKIYITTINRLRKESNNAIIHYQLNNWLELFVICILCHKSYKIYTTVHSFRWNEYNLIVKMAFRLCEKASKIQYVAPSQSIKEELVYRGVETKKINIISTYLPPAKEEYKERVPKEIMSFLKRTNNIIVLANASKLYKDKSGIDVYGMDMCIEACYRLKTHSFIFCVPQYDTKYMLECKKSIRKYDLQDRFYIYTGLTNLVPILKSVDCFVRPTSTDSYGISVAEAINVGVPSIASDVCEREEGTIIFKSRDIDDFCKKLQKIKKNNKVKTNSRNYYLKYQEMYQNITKI